MNTTTAHPLHSSNNDRFNAEAAAWDANPDVHRASDGALQALLATYGDDGHGHGGGSSSSRSHSHSSSSSRIHLTTTDPQTDVLEIGCGTGLLSFRLAPYVRSILAVDAAEGMISALEAKLESAAAAEDDMNRTYKSSSASAAVIITPLCILLQDAEDPRLPPAISHPTSTSTTTTTPPQKTTRKKFDLITSHLVLHHIPTAAIPSLLQTMHAALKPGGEVALTDYQDFGPEARKFHPEAKMNGVESPRGIDAVWFEGLLREAGFVDVHVNPQWTMEKEIERFPGEWGQEKPTGDLAKMDFPFLLCRGRKKET